MLTSRSGVVSEVRSTGLPPRDLAVKRVGIVSFLLLSAWCGLVSGLLEVGIILSQVSELSISTNSTG